MNYQYLNLKQREKLIKTGLKDFGHNKFKSEHIMAAKRNRDMVMLEGVRESERFQAYCKRAWARRILSIVGPSLKDTSLGEHLPR